MAGLEFELCTFSLVGRCERTGMLGVVVSTHAIAGGARCPHVRAGVGAIATQAITDPRLGPLVLDLLEAGFSAEAALAAAVAATPKPEYRQIGVVDWNGKGAAHTGEANKGWAGHIVGEHFVSLGNNLVSEETVRAMADVFQQTAELDLEERLLRGIEAGRDAGGQNGGQRSAGLTVYGKEPYPWVDLRVDAHDEPIAELRRVYEIYRPTREYFSKRVQVPDLPSPPDV